MQEVDNVQNVNRGGSCDRAGFLTIEGAALGQVVPHAERVDRSTGAAADRLPVSSIMTNDVVCVRPDVTIGSLTELLLDLDLSGVPVVDDTGHAIGVVSKTDLIRHHRALEDWSAAQVIVDAPFELGFRGEHGAPGTVADVMTHVVFTVPEEASISSAAAVMSYRNVHRLPVVNASGTVVGLLSSIDIVDWVAQGAPEQLARRRSRDT